MKDGLSTRTQVKCARSRRVCYDQGSTRWALARLVHGRRRHTCGFAFTCLRRCLMPRHQHPLPRIKDRFHGRCTSRARRLKIRPKSQQCCRKAGKIHVMTTPGSRVCQMLRKDHVNRSVCHQTHCNLAAQQSTAWQAGWHSGRTSVHWKTPMSPFNVGGPQHRVACQTKNIPFGLADADALLSTSSLR